MCSESDPSILIRYQRTIKILADKKNFGQRQDFRANCLTGDLLAFIYNSVRLSLQIIRLRARGSMDHAQT